MPRFRKHPLTRNGVPIENSPKGLDPATHRVTKVEGDGSHVRVMFERVDGQIAVGIYERVGWAWCPDNLMGDYDRMAKKAPVAVFSSRKANRG